MVDGETVERGEFKRNNLNQQHTMFEVRVIPAIQGFNQFFYASKFVAKLINSPAFFL